MPLATQVLLAILAIIAAVYDIRYRRIPNWLVASGLLLGIALNTFLFEWAGLKSALLGVGLATLIYFPLYLLRGMGAGDVKLMMAVGGLAGPAPWFVIFIITGILGGLIAVVLLILRKRFKKTFWNLGFLLHRLMHFQAPYTNPELDVQSGAGVRLPHGAVIGAGIVVFLTVSRFMIPA